MVGCTLTGDELQNRLALIAELNRDALRHYERGDLVLTLHYAGIAAPRVRSMMRNEQTCCSFLIFALHKSADEVRLTITAPAAAGAAAAALFDEFIKGARRS